MMKIDLNSDLGESFGMYTIGNDSDVLNYVSSANIACGMHAGDPFVMHKTVRLALERGVAVGAHPGFMDLNGFGRRNIVMKPDEIYDLIVYQVGALSAALYNMAAKDQAMSEAIAKAVYDVDPQLVLFGLAGSWLVKAGEAAGLQTASEVFADRTYQEDGSLTPRTQPNAMITDDAASIRQVLTMITEGKVRTATGKDIPVKADTVCIHGDSPKALAFARSIGEALQKEQIQITSFIHR